MPVLGYSVPVPRTWYALMPVKANYLRADAAQAAALLTAPPVFLGQQAASPQTVANSTDTPVSIDTEFYDNAGGHLDTTSPANYYCMLPGWYLCQGTAAVAYTGGAGATVAGIALSVAGAAITTWYGGRGPNSGTTGQRMQPSAAKLVEMVNTSRATGDYVNLVISQNSGASQTMAVATSRNPWLQAQWVAAASANPSSLPVPANDPWAPSTTTPPYYSTTLTTSAVLGSSVLHVASAAGLVAGGTIGLDGGTSIAETAVVASGYAVGSLVVPLVASLAHTHASGAQVAVPVSAAFMNRNVRDTINFLTYPPIMEAYYLAGTASLASQASLPAVGHVIPCDTTTVDNYGAYSTSSHTWTAPVAGTYWCYVQSHQSMNTTSVALAAGLTITSLNYNSGTQFTWWGGTQAAFAGAGAGNCVVTRRRLRLNAGDTIQPAAFQNDSGSNAVTQDYVGGSSVSESRMIIVWRGA